MKRLCPLVILVLALAASDAVAQPTQEAGIDPAQWVPDDVLAYVGIADTRQLGEELARTTHYRNAQALPAKDMPTGMSVLRKTLEGLKRRLGKALGIEPEKLRNPFAGPMALYVLAPPGDPADGVKAVFVASVGDAELMRTYYDGAMRKLAERAGRHEQIQFGLYTMERFTRESPATQPDGKLAGGAKPGDALLGALDLHERSFPALLEEFPSRLFSPESMPDELVFCLADDRLIIAPTPEQVKDVLRRERMGASLAETDAYRTLLRVFKPLGSIRFWVNLSRLFELMEVTEGAKASQALTTLGAESATGVVGHILYDGRQFEGKCEALVLFRGQPSGLAKILSMKNRPVSPPPSVPDDSGLYASLNVDVLATVDELERMVRREDAEAADELRATVESMQLPDGQTLNLRQELLENLSPPLTFVLGFRRPYGPQSTYVRVTIGQRDQKVTARFLEKLSNLWPGSLIQREVGGAVAYDVLGGVSVASEEQVLVVGTSAAVDETLQGVSSSGSLAADPRFQQAAALVPAEAWGVLYVDSRRVYEAALELSKNKAALMGTQLQNPANVIALKMAEAFASDGDEDQSEAARQTAKYLAPSIYTATTTPDGILLTQIELLPTGE